MLAHEINALDQVPCTFTPKITKKTVEITNKKDRSNRYEQMYQHHKVQKENYYRLKAKYNHIPFDFEPKLMADPLRESITSKFLDRLSHSVEKKSKHLESERSKVQHTFSPHINKKSRVSEAMEQESKKGIVMQKWMKIYNFI